MAVAYRRRSRARVEGKPAKPIVIPADEFGRMFLRHHKAGEHVAIVGPTGGGKSTVAYWLCELIGTRKTKDRRPAHVVIIGLKLRDSTLQAMTRRGWTVIKKWPPAFGEEHCIVWPRAGAASGRAVRQAEIVGPLLDIIEDEGGQTVCIDEEAKVERPLPKGLGLASTMEAFWSEARSGSLTLIAATQRPRMVTRLMWSEPSWVIIMRVEDDQDLDRVAELSGSREAVYEIVPRLGGFEFLCIRRQRAGGRGLYVSRADKIG